MIKVKVKPKISWPGLKKWCYVVQHYNPHLGWIDWAWETTKERAKRELDRCRGHRKERG